MGRGRYPLAKKIAEFTQHVEMMVGQQGWQGRLTASWNAKQEEFADKTLGSRKLYIVKHKNSILSPIAQVFYDYARKYYEKHPEKAPE